jgi:hypothetical protein
MTVAAQTPPLTFDTIEEAIREVRQAGMRLSTPRRLIVGLVRRMRVSRNRVGPVTFGQAAS